MDDDFRWGMLGKVESFHVCNELRGLHLNIDIEKFNEFTEEEVLESYMDVCTCINVPLEQNVTSWSINNFGNEFLAYYQPNCSENKWKAKLIPAGLGSNNFICMDCYTKLDRETNTEYQIQSIGPNPNSTYYRTSCQRVS